MKPTYILVILSIALLSACQQPSPPPPAPAPLAPAPQATTQPSRAIILSEFVFQKAPFPSCHASTIAQTKDGLVASFFGGTRERAPDVGIWVSRNVNKHWSPLVEVATGKDDAGKPVACWNPVLFQVSNGPLLLFYKVGPAPKAWWGMLTTSTDQGVTWSTPQRLPKGFLGPIKDKPIALPDGSLLCPSSTEDNGSQIHFERTADLGKTWTKTEPLNEGKTLKLIQPTILDHGPGNLQFLCRSHNDLIFQGFSTDNGQTWTAPVPTTLPNPNSGIDAVQLKDGRSLLVYNHSTTDRTPLEIAVSPDGKTWGQPWIIETTDDQGQLSYPAVIQTSDGLVHITYTWKRHNIRHVVLDPAKIP